MSGTIYRETELNKKESSKGNTKRCLLYIVRRNKNVMLECSAQFHQEVDTDSKAEEKYRFY
jgi:hypothetical protein